MATQSSASQPDCARVQKALVRSVDEAGRQQAVVAIAIVNASGILAGFMKMPDSFLAAVDYAQWKAWTAASFGMPSQDFGKLVGSFDSLTRNGLLAHPKATPLPGGFPIYDGSNLIGAIGVSGGSGEQDEAIAKAGLDAFNDGCSGV